MELELNTIIGDPAKLGRDCEIHQHKRLIYSFIICYIRMIVFVGIIQILMFYNVISFSHWLPDGPQVPTSRVFLLIFTYSYLFGNKYILSKLVILSRCLGIWMEGIP